MCPSPKLINAQYWRLALTCLHTKFQKIMVNHRGLCFAHKEYIHQDAEIWPSLFIVPAINEIVTYKTFNYMYKKSDRAWWKRRWTVRSSICTYIVRSLWNEILWTPVGWRRMFGKEWASSVMHVASARIYFFHYCLIMGKKRDLKPLHLCLVIM